MALEEKFNLTPFVFWGQMTEVGGKLQVILPLHFPLEVCQLENLQQATSRCDHHTGCGANGNFVQLAPAIGVLVYSHLIRHS